MGIKGLSDIRRFPRAGKIRLGYRSESAKSGRSRSYPAKADHFVWPEEHSALLTEAFGDECRELDIMFPVEDLEVVASQYYRRYSKDPSHDGAGRLVCRGDGETASFFDRETGEIAEIECLGTECESYRAGRCKRTMFLQFIIPQFMELGVWQLDTSSANSIINVNSGIEYIRAITGGRFAMVPMKLRLVPKEVFPPDVGRTTIYVLELKPAPGVLGSPGRVPAGIPEPARIAALPSAEEIESEAPDDLYPDAVIVEEPPEQPRRISEIDAEIDVLFNSLGLTQAQRTLRLREWGTDKVGLLARLREEFEARRRRGRPAPDSHPGRRGEISGDLEPPAEQMRM